MIEQFSGWDVKADLQRGIFDLRPEWQIFYILQKFFISIKLFAPALLEKVMFPPLLNHDLGICEGSLKCEL